VHTTYQAHANIKTNRTQNFSRMRLKPIHASYSLSFLLVSLFKKYFGLKSFEKRITRIKTPKNGKRAPRGKEWASFFTQLFWVRFLRVL